MEQLTLNGVYEIFLGGNSSQKGIYLGRNNGRGVRKILVRTNEGESRDGIGFPRVYSFTKYESNGSQLIIKAPKLARRLESNIKGFAEKVLSSKGI